MRGLPIILTSMAFFGSLSAHAEPAQLELVMVEEPGCMWCARWNAEIGHIYPLTPEGDAAPLRRIDISETTPEDLQFASAPFFTPTFILVNNGIEVGRIEGYPGEDFFWGLLGRLFDKVEVTDTEEPTQ